ncbi:MAG: hypothetical protein GXO11_00870 [Epsilonproteobacteria bacterium]|nr:hypothetical protein [Campylobacterota bacterium]
MADKAKYLQDFQNMKKTHEQQVLQLEFLLQNNRSHEEIEKEDAFCNFNVWALDNPMLEKLLGVQIYQKLITTHAQWHTYYKKILQILFEENRTGLLRKLFSSKPSPQAIDKAKAYFDDLQQATKELDHAIAVCERRLNALNESKFS